MAQKTQAATGLEDLVTYDVALPNKSALTAGRVLGWVLIVASVAWMITMVIWWLFPSSAPLVSEEGDTWSFVGSIEASSLDELQDKVDAYRAESSEESTSTGYYVWNDMYITDMYVADTIAQEVPVTVQGWWWIIAAAGMAAGITLVAVTSRMLYRFYRKVLQGIVVDRDTSGGGDYPLSWYLVIEGHTLANELRRDIVYVSAGDWQDYKNGDVVDFRD